jgi:hypothetical protein
MTGCNKSLRVGVVPNLIAANPRGSVQGVNPANFVCAGRRINIGHEGEVGFVQSKH